MAIDKLKFWCDSNELQLNLEKCFVMSICRRREQITRNYSYGNHCFKRVTEQRDLGIVFDNKLNFIKHIDSMVAKAYSALGFVKRFCYDIPNTHTLKSLYCTLVQSILEYGSLVWLPYYEIHKNKMFALKEYPNISNNFVISSFKTRLKKLNMHSLQRRRINTAIMFLFDVIHNNVYLMGIN